EREVGDDFRRRLQPALLERAHEMDAAARRVGFRAQLQVGGTGGQAEAAMDAGEKLVRLDEARLHRALDLRTPRPEGQTGDGSRGLARRARTRDARRLVLCHVT